MKNYLKIIAVTGFIIAILATQISPVFAKEEPEYTDEGSQEYTEVQRDVLNRIPEMERKYLEYGLQAPVSADPKGSVFRTAIGRWSWRDGLICVTTE